jgi:hypothetical protein
VDDVAHGDIKEKVIPDSEGRKRLVQHVSYERSRKNRELAIKIHGTVCQVCGFDFDEVYEDGVAQVFGGAALRPPAIILTVMLCGPSSEARFREKPRKALLAVV